MIYSVDEAKERVIEAGRELLKRGLIARTWGNVSARISDTQFVITPSGLPYDSLTPEMIVTVNIADGSFEGNVKPSSEKGVHAAAYRQRPDAGFVIHTHQDYATALSVLGQTFRIRKTDEADRALLGPEIPTARYALSSTKALAKNVEDALKACPDSRCVLMRSHGALCIGETDREALAAADRLETAARQRYRRLASIYWPAEASKGRPLEEYADILHRDIHEEYDRRYLVFDDPKINCIVEARAPFIVRMSESGKSMPVCVDDLAQMAGIRIRCLKEGASDKTIAAALKGGGAVFIKGKGALCAAGSEDDAKALMIVLNKACRAALLGEAGCDVHPVSAAEGIIEHLVYKTKYSKLAENEVKNAEETDG